MAPTRIPLGPADRLTQLLSYPNTPGSNESLGATVMHWLNQTFANDGATTQGLTATLEGDDSGYTLVLDGPAAVATTIAGYSARIPQFFDVGWTALSTVVPQLKAAGKWDPSPDPPPPPYRPWRFFLTLGLPMVNHKTLQFFHYPPIRLLEQTRNYLDDPVPVRCFELLEANGISASDVGLYSRVVDATPIAAGDSQGSKKAGDPVWGVIPIQYFADYQRSLVELLLNPAPNAAGYTVPIVVYGAHPRAIFEKLFNVKLSKPGSGFTPAADVAAILPGMKTAVVGSNHPYVFYAAAQGFPTVGSGHFLSAAACKSAAAVMRGDLAIVRWQVVMAADPSQDPQKVLDDCTAYWNDPARDPEVCALTRHQASLFYSDPVSLAYAFKQSLADAAAACATNGNNPCA